MQTRSRSQSIEPLNLELEATLRRQRRGVLEPTEENMEEVRDNANMVDEEGNLRNFQGGDNARGGFGNQEYVPQVYAQQMHLQNQQLLAIIQNLLAQQEARNDPPMVQNQPRRNGNNGVGMNIRDHFQPQYGNYVVGPPVNVNHFEIKTGLINMVQANQFGGGTMEDPNAHLAQFTELANTVKINGVSEDVIKLKLFSFSLRDRAKA